MGLAFRNVLTAVVRAAIVAGLALLVSRMDLFGLDTDADRTADGIQQRIFAVCYGRKLCRGDPAGQAPISVVHVDDAGLRYLRTRGWATFPPSYEDQALLLWDLKNQTPRPPAAIFIDFVYHGEPARLDYHPPDPPAFSAFELELGETTAAAAWNQKEGCLKSTLLKIACIIEAGGTPVILGAPGPEPNVELTPLQKRLDAVAVRASVDVSANAYPIVRKEDGHLSPAGALFAAYCMGLPEDNRPASCDQQPFVEARRAAADLLGDRAAVSVSPLARFTDSLDVVWGAIPPQSQWSLVEKVSGRALECRGDRGGLWARTWDQFARLRSPGEGADAECLYHRNLGYDRLVKRIGLEDADINDLLQGRLVLVGSQLQASNDFAPSPVHGQVPGVYLHAMALDNLLVNGDAYRRSFDDKGAFGSDELEALLTFVLAVFGTLALIYRQSLLDRAQAAGEVRLKASTYLPLYAAIVGVSLLTIALVSALGEFLMRTALINWLEVAGVVMAYLAITVRESLPGDIAGSMRAGRYGGKFLGLLDQVREFLAVDGAATPTDHLSPSSQPEPTHASIKSRLAPGYRRRPGGRHRLRSAAH